jgi:hypothetical protein
VSQVFFLSVSLSLVASWKPSKKEKTHLKIFLIHEPGLFLLKAANKERKKRFGINYGNLDTMWKGEKKSRWWTYGKNKDGTEMNR